MIYYENDKERSNKIPYDKEPIIRQTNYKKPRQTTQVGVPSKPFAFILAVLIIFNIVLCGLVIGVLKNNGDNIYNNTYHFPESNLSSATTQVASTSINSVVCIHIGLAETKPSYADFFNKEKLLDVGTGVIFDGDKQEGICYIVTCYHVVKNAPTYIHILFHNSFIPVKADLVSYSSLYDIAVLKVTSDVFTTSDATIAPVADSSLLSYGQEVVAIGNPMGANLSATSGIISVPVELVDVGGIIYRVMRTSAAINGGNSGGGLFNMRGELIGIVNAKANDVPSKNNYVDNIAYAIPSNLAISLAYNMLRNGTPMKAIIGLEFAIQSTTTDFIGEVAIPVQTIQIDSVEEGSAAAKAGLKVGDVITAFEYNGQLVNMINFFSFDDHEFNLSLGDEVTFYINGATSGIKVVVDKILPADFTQGYQA